MKFKSNLYTHPLFCLSISFSAMVIIIFKLVQFKKIILISIFSQYITHATFLLGEMFSYGVNAAVCGWPDIKYNSVRDLVSKFGTGQTQTMFCGDERRRHSDSSPCFKGLRMVCLSVHQYLEVCVCIFPQ